jgi:hypothetical protein
VLDVMDDALATWLLPMVPVGDIWGIGRKTDAKLQKLGIYTAAGYCQSKIGRGGQGDTLSPISSFPRRGDEGDRQCEQTRNRPLAQQSS